MMDEESNSAPSSPSNIVVYHDSQDTQDEDFLSADDVAGAGMGAANAPPDATAGHRKTNSFLVFDGVDSTTQSPTSRSTVVV